MKDEFVRHGWNTDCLRTQEEAEATDYSRYDLILFDTYENKLSVDCFRKKIAPQVRNGAVLFVNSYYWCNDLDKKFETGATFAWGCHFNLITGEWSVEPVCRTETIAPGR